MIDRSEYVVLGLTGIILAIVFCLIISPCNAKADDFLSGEDRIVPISAGDRAPFSGQLFDTDTAIRFGLRLQTCQLKLDEQVEHAGRLLVLEREHWEQRLRIETDASRAREVLFQDALDTERGRADSLLQQLVEEGDIPWYQTFGFGFAAGVATSAVLVGLMVWLVAGTL